MSDRQPAFKPTGNMSQIEPDERVILALDFSSAAESLVFLDDLRRRCSRAPRWVKVGLELFCAEGPALVTALRAQGYSIFLDLKLHDIPNTVSSAIRALAALEVQMLTVHASGGPTMLRAAAETALALPCPPRLLAVTVLTSMEDAELKAVGVSFTPEEQVLRLAREAWRAGIQGLVSSPLEAARLREEFGSRLHLVTPGIRPAHVQSKDDQLRVATPSAALRQGASQLVIGRPVTRAPDPAAAYDAILAEVRAVHP